VIDATRAASAHRFAFDPGDDLAHAAMNAGTERYMPGDAAGDLESVGPLPAARHDWLRRSAAGPSERQLLRAKRTSVGEVKALCSKAPRKLPLFVMVNPTKPLN
jgi:hypothetical protein